MKKELFFDRHSGLIVSALAEDGQLSELGIENESHKDLVGNVYKGKVVNVIESMNAAFVACGLERNCFLPLTDAGLTVDPSKYDSQYGAVTEHAPSVRAGDEIVVQIVKNPRGNKGAKITTKLSFVGKNLIFLPETDFLGISRKIKEPELRKNLLFTVDSMRGKGNGLIVRTIAPYATRKRLTGEAAYLKNLWQSVIEKAESAAVGEVLYHEHVLPVRVLRDTFNEDIERIVVGEEKLYRSIMYLAALRPDLDAKNVELYEGKRDMLTQYGIEPQIRKLSEGTVELPNGGNLVIERTEALTVVDVNTAKFVGDENLEDTVYAVNIAAAREIARQVRLRDVGGIVVVDFIDMQEERHRAAVQKELELCLSKDHVKSKVLPMSEFCLVEFARKRTSNGVDAQLLQPCTHCRRSGYILSYEFIVCRIRAAVLERLSAGETQIVVDLNRSVLEFLRDHPEYVEARYRADGACVYFVPHRTYHEEDFTVSSLGKEVSELPLDAETL